MSVLCTGCGGRISRGVIIEVKIIIIRLYLLVKFGIFVRSESIHNFVVVGIGVSETVQNAANH